MSYAHKIYLAGVFSLAIFGIFILASASAYISQTKFGNLNFFIWHQIFYGFVPGSLLFLAASFFPYRLYKRTYFIFFIISIFALLIVFSSTIGFEHAQARRWIKIFDTTVQPVEFVKIFAVIFFARWASLKKGEIQDFKKGILPYFFLASFLLLPLAIQPDFDNALIIFLAVLAIIFLAGARILHVFFVLIFGLMFFFLALMIYPERLERISTYFESGVDIFGKGYHSTQAQRAISSGGFFGVGYGKGLSKQGSLPEPYGDSIFAVYIEEMGLAGGLLLVLFYLVIFILGYKEVNKSSDSFASLLGAGILIIFIFQAMIHISANIGLIPLSGLTLPLISFGGSSLLATLIGLGIVYNIMRSVKA